MSKKMIVVVGATGAQGGGLARAILAERSGELSVRALTRKPEGDKARELAKAGAEVVGADLDDGASVRSAFRGAHGAFCVTNFWEHFSPERELAQAKTMAAAAKDAGVAHVIWSTLEDTRELCPLADRRMPTLKEKYKVPHFDAKGEADAFFRDLPATLLRTSFYWENLIFFGMGPKVGSDGKLAFVLPMGNARLPGISAEDIGRCAHRIFERGPEFVGKTIGIAGDMPTGKEMAAALSRGLEREVVHQDVPPEVYRGFGFPGADDLGNMFQYKRDFNAAFCGARDLALSRSLTPGLLNFPQWVGLNKSRIPVG
jgi:uncharacterized protein YbjT (DUF2867 family)